MRGLISVGALIAIAAANSAAAPDAPDFRWLAGAWCGESDGTVSEELWMAPRGGLMLGMHRDTRDGRASGFEFLRIELRPGGATYLAQPGGKPSTTFELRSSSARSATFANEAHDFPRRIIYERLDASRLKARVDDGSDRGKAQEWTWSRCEPHEGF